MTPDELKAIPKGSFIVMKTGFHPVQTQLRLYLDWGITFGDPYILPEKSARKVAYADKRSLSNRIREKYPQKDHSKGQQTAQPEKELTEADSLDTPYNIGGSGS